MAIAKRGRQLIPPPPLAFETFIDLRLSLEEARTLGAILMFVGGDRGGSRRRHAEDISRALSDAEVRIGDRADISGSGIFFRPA